jgi:hypothetical protein
MKRWLCAWVISALLLGSLAGCGGGGVEEGFAENPGPPPVIPDMKSGAMKNVKAQRKR